MASRRKRGRQEMEEPSQPVQVPQELSLLQRIRNSWEFAALAQYIWIFGNAVKVSEDVGIEELEMECLKSHSTILPELGLALLKFVSSHRGLTPELFDEYTRRQYVAKAPDRNPFGVEEEPHKFVDFDVFTKLRVLQQLTQWTMGNPDRIREKMEEKTLDKQIQWRMEPFGYDSDLRLYFVLDDNRVYRRTDPPLPPPKTTKPKKGTKKAKAALRASKRRKVSEAAESESEEPDVTSAEPREDNGFGGMKWECLVVTLDECKSFIASLEKSRDPNERELRKDLTDRLLPLLEADEETRRRKEEKKQRELINIEKLATAKRSSRIAGKQELQKQEEDTREAERKKRADLEMARKEQEKWQKLEHERESRMMTREQRLKERESRRILHEEELEHLSEDSRRLETGEASRQSERHLKAEIERKKQALEELNEPEEDWIFDCICGAYGQIDDGTHSIACDKCNVWQHSKCAGISEAEADRADFSYVCVTCVRRADDEKRPKVPIKIKINPGGIRPGSSSSPAPPAMNGTGDKQSAKDPSSVLSSPQKPSVPSQVAPKLPQLYTFAAHQPHLSPVRPPAHSLSTPHNAGSRPVSSLPAQAPHPPNDLPTYSGLNATASTGLSSPPAVKGPPAILPGSINTSRPVTANGGNLHSYGKNPFSSPVPNSPTSLPPPFPNGYRPFDMNSGAEVPRPMSSTSPKQFTPSQPANGHLNGSTQERRSSITLPSPLIGAPVLTPSNKSTSSLDYNSYQANNMTQGAPQPNMAPAGSSPPTQGLLPQSQVVSALPQGTGISPTKNSPPRLSAFNDLPGFAQPSILPPATSLSPSQSHQDLSPPVKSAEPERNRLLGQNMAP